MFDYNLVVVGTGIRTLGQMTLESIAWIEKADKVYYIVGDPIAQELIQNLNPNGAESLYHLYGENKPRIDTYNQMIETIMNSVRAGNMTVGAFYGHPGVFAYPSHESVKQAKREGFKSIMLPGVSAEDCLFADLGVDPAVNGCQSYEATDFMMNNRVIDNSSQVILWQIGVLGNWTYKKLSYDLSSIPLILERLYQYYPPNHEVTAYEASIVITCEPKIIKVPLCYLGHAQLTAATTLYIPPVRQSTPNPDTYYKFSQMMAKG